MASEEIGLVLSHRPQNHHHHHQQPPLFFQNNHHHLAGNTSVTINNNNKTTRELTGFIEHQNRHFQPNSRSIFQPSDDDDDDDDGSDTHDDDDDDDDDDEDGHVTHVVGFVNNTTNTDNNNSNKNVTYKSSEKNVINGKRNHLASIGNDVRSSLNDGDQLQGELCQYQNAITTVADPNGEMYYSHYLNGVVEGSGSGSGMKDVLVDNGTCGFSGRKDVSNSGESLRAVLSDPLTGALMDDAMILPCGHSFGSSGMQHVMRMKACYTCSHPLSEGSVSPNLSLQSAVHAFLREEEGQTRRASKRRNRLDQDRVIYGDPALGDQSRGWGVQFPFCVTERVIIKGNKRTPPRFVGREAIVTTQCLNGWYVVKTLDNAESVKLQYRSLAKVQDSQKSSILASSKITTPNWL